MTGCPNRVARGGVCARHGAKNNMCGFEGCLNQAKKGGRCMRHVDKVERPNAGVCKPAPNPAIVHQASPKGTGRSSTDMAAAAVHQPTNTAARDTATANTEVNTNAAATSTTMHAV